MTEEEKYQYRSDLKHKIEAFGDLEAEMLLRLWELWARPNQLAPEGNWTYWAIIAGRGFGKTRCGAEWVRGRVKDGRFPLVNMVGATADDARDIMIEGESGILAICPRWERPEYQVSKRRLVWPNGAQSLIFTADEPERLRGKQHHSIWCDEVAAWRYEEAWDQAMLGLRIGPDPRAVVTTTPRPKAIVRDILERPRLEISKGTTYDNESNLAPAFFEEIIRKYEGTRMGNQELLAELLLDEGLAFRVEQGVHIVPPFEVPDHWDRYESMDWGANHPSSWGCYAVDTGGNVVGFDMYYSPGLISEQAEAILKKREEWYPPGMPPVVLAPPDIRRSFPVKDWRGKEMTIESEFADHGITFRSAQNDRRAGYMRIVEMLHRRQERVFPEWHPLRGQPGSPSFFIFDTEAMRPLIKQLRDAPLEDPDSPLSKFPNEAVDGEWESANGHAVAMLRYGLMARKPPSRQLAPVIDDPRERLMREHLARIDNPRPSRARYIV